MFTLCLTFWGTTEVFSTAAAPFYIPTNTGNITLRIFHVFTNIYFLVFWTVLSYWSSDFIPLTVNDVEQLYSVLISNLYIFLEKCLFKSFSPIKKYFIFIYLFVCVGSLVVACKLLVWHVGSSSVTRDWTWALCTETLESQPLDHQGSPGSFLSWFTSFCYWVVKILYILWILSDLWLANVFPIL